MKTLRTLFMVAACAILVRPVGAEGKTVPETTSEAETADEEEAAAAEASSMPFDLGQLHVYGYFSTRLEKTFNEPGLGDDGLTVYQDSPAEWSIPFFHVMLQHRVSFVFGQ